MPSTVVDQIEELYKDKYEDLVRMYKSRAGESDVEDVIQEGFYRALLYTSSFNPTYITVEKWVAGIINNCLKDMLREKRDGKIMHSSDEEPTIEDRCPSDTELEEKILKIIDRKTGDTRQILWLYFTMGYKPEEITMVLGNSSLSTYAAIRDFKHACQTKYGHLMVD